MTQEEKQLLLKDLSARLPYGVICRIYNTEHKAKEVGVSFFEPKLTLDILDYIINNKNDISDIKPYLRPMSSMTEKEKETYESFVKYGEYDTGSLNGHYEYNYVEIDKINDFINWLNTHHFDNSGLIEKGLALEASKDMYKFE